MVVEIKRQVCDGHMLKWLVAAGLSWLEHNMGRVNEMNVFPVPDGDTGTNMFHTMERAYKEIAHLDEDHVGIVSQALARGALMGARGNSGTILSQILRGFAEALKGYEVFDAALFARACQSAVASAYKALTDPREGTILTVAREAAEAVVEEAQLHSELKRLLERMIEEAHASLQRTPELLPILKEAGVVDSGGLGLIYILEGMLRMIEGKPVSYNGHSATNGKPHADHWQEALIPEDEDGYGYDVQFLMRGNNMDVERVRADIDAMGWSTVVVGDDSLIKVHVHVHNPGEPLSYAIQMGAELDDIVVENMQAQYHEYVENRIARESGKTKEIEGVAVITVANGDGICALCDDLHAARIIAGGQTMNPSTEDFLVALESLSNSDVIILPNNSNIILAAKQAADLCREKNVYVLPTKTIPQGISALIAYGDARETGSPQRILEAMGEAAAHVVSIEITYATRNVEMDGVRVSSGQIIGLVDDKLVAAGDDIEQVARAALQRAHAEDYELATIYYGQDVTAEQAETLAEQLASEFTNLELEVVYGGQPLYPYIISIE